MKKVLIISRFNEDIRWLEKIKGFKIIIYNKGEKLSNDKFKNIINLNNVGRESHTYLYHIVNNYSNLDDINIFLQGSVDDLNCMAFKNPNDYLKNIDKFGFAVSRYGLLGPYHWDKNIYLDKDPKYKEDWKTNKISKSNLGFREFAKKFFPEIPWFVATSYSGCFAVKKETIRKYDINFYIELLDILSKNKNPIEGHYMERLWCYLFTENEPLINSFFDVIRTKIERFNLKRILNKLHNIN